MKGMPQGPSSVMAQGGPQTSTPTAHPAEEAQLSVTMRQVVPYISFANGEHILRLWCSPGVHEHLRRRWWQTRICCLPGATRWWHQRFAATGEAFPSAQNLDVFHILAECAMHGPAHS